MTILSLIFLLYPPVANSYIPDYNLAINCGSSSDTTTLGNRTWVGDNSNLFTFIQPKTTNPSLNLPPNSLPNAQTPYTTARVSLSNFTYSFPINNITNSPVFIRLHFYPTSYQNFEPSNAFFSVTVNNNLTLLKNFNPSLWQLQDEEKITKEYCIQIKPNENLLNITFIPNNINTSNVYYAFINGIEVVSMPPFLYYTDLTDTNYNIKSVEFDSNQYQYQYQVLSDKALEMVYRVNVGDNQVPPSNDTGMFRNWDNDNHLYLEKQYPQSVSADYGGHLNYLHNSIPNYTAPEVVYLTARSYGMYVKEDYNVTWNFEVDSVFTYMVRLHFCEFDWHIEKENDRIFQIFIDDKLAEPGADIISWTVIRMVPVHKDYVVTMYSPDRSSRRVKLSIKLQRASKTIPMKYYDVTLNGIEIFKISDNNNLAGLNPDKHILSSPQQKPLQNQKSKSKKSTITMVVVIGFSCLLLVFVVGIIVFLRRRRRYDSQLQMQESSWKTQKEGSSTLPSHLCRYFTIAEIRAATNNFDDIFIIGVGGFGNVYKGYIDGVIPVAIKRLKPGSQQGVNEFMNEIELLSQLRHIHLVSLIGYCNEGTEMILVYDFMQRGTLCEYLYGSDNEHLTWKQRLEILLGAARGLHYLHAVLCARPPLVRSADKKKSSLVIWFQRCYKQGLIVEELVDPFIKDSITDESLKCYCQMVLSCLHDDGNQRMSMSDVVGALEFALQLVTTEEDSKFTGTKEKEKSEQRLLLPQFMSDDGSDVCFTSSSDDYGSHTSTKDSTISTSTEGQPMLSATVFSEIGNPRAR
ncbi:hypothetical protein TSUD_170110 [Trifolium subterraneum]|uniref:Protein kinase domain-containing protein n=1 Tax=Trifolium subterraneum TaxID=3900 RepID=A0A2Z6NYB2_TRISU|nr:hypothetical protein TSUD_170110 [Trifolium subterraneum]